MTSQTLRSDALSDRVALFVGGMGGIGTATPLARWGEPVEGTAAVVLLVSPAGHCVTGAVPVVDGGYTIA